MTVRSIEWFSDTDRELLERKIADFLVQNPVDDVEFSTADTQNGILYSVAMKLVTPESLAQI